MSKTSSDIIKYFTGHDDAYMAITTPEELYKKGCYYYHIESARDLVKAKHCFTHSARGGNVKAMVTLALIYWSEVPQDYIRAKKLLKLAALVYEDIAAIVLLAEWELQFNIPWAMELYQRAAVKDHPFAVFILGLIYDDIPVNFLAEIFKIGIERARKFYVVKQDLSKAHMYYAKAMQLAEESAEPVSHPRVVDCFFRAQLRVHLRSSGGPLLAAQKLQDKESYPAVSKLR
ncbi:MAG: hypothetical protein KBD64_06720 [Gammaproteobacteria bacterium]|nr:hypothetical protein [Gammaproteobacteria bacterium]